MRKYEGKQNTIWDGDTDCNHEFVGDITKHDNLRHRGQNSDVGNNHNAEIFSDENVSTGFCAKCKAFRGQLGLEPSPDCGKSWVDSDEIELREDLTEEEKKLVIAELVRLGILG